MIARSVSLLLLVLSSVSWASGLENRSAHREPGVSYRLYKSRQHSPRVSTPESEAVRFGQANLPAATAWKSEATMQEWFGKMRDERFFDDSSHPNFLRRSSWLYPDDGCFARAALGVRNLKQWSQAAPNKIFVFGDLRVKTANSPLGEVTWWYHVAPLVEVDGEKYVLDPALNPKAPLKLREWLGMMGPNIDNLEVAVCGSGSYWPSSDCQVETDGIEAGAMADQQYYLDAEWSRLEELNRNPVNELGELPPWL